MNASVAIAFRTLRKTPGFTAIAIAIVALGIGAATTLFSTVNTLVLRPIALPESDRLAAVYETNLPRNQPFFSVSIPNYVDWKARTQSWTSLAAVNWRPMNLSGRGTAEMIWGRAITANFLPTFGLALQQGRNFTEDEDRPGGAPVAVVSDAFWRRRLDASPNAVGQTLLLDGQPHTVVGVLRAGQHLPGNMEVAVPLAANPSGEDRMNHEMEVYGRLRPGVTLAQAEAELRAVVEQLWTEHPEADRGWSVRLLPYARDVVGGHVRTGLFVLLGAIGVLLVLVCANLSTLLLLRATSRGHDFALRVALGASRGQVLWQVVIEALIVALIGGALGVVLALWAVDAMHTVPLPRAAEISLDLRVLAAAVTLTLVCGLLASLVPAWRAARCDPMNALKVRSSRVSGRSPAGHLLVAAQIALSLTLLIGATLLARSFLKLLKVDPGFSPGGAITISLRPLTDGAGFYEKLTTQLNALPGIAVTGVTNLLPLTEGNTSLNVLPHGPSRLAPGSSIQANWRLIDGGYFAAMEIPVLRGRTFAGLSPTEARQAVILSASLARQLWGDEDPVGRQIDPGGNGRHATVIGIVGDVRSQTLGAEPTPTFYWSMHRFVYGPMHVVIRPSLAAPGQATDPRLLLPMIRATVAALDPAVPVFLVRTLDQIRGDSLEQEHIVLGLLSGFTSIAVLLAALGTYSIIAFSVQQRTPEIGVRIALGASSTAVQQLVLTEAARVVALGLVLGTIVTALGARLLSALLYDTAPTDPTSYAIAILTLALAAGLACWWPARRATRIDPIIALRAE